MARFLRYALAVVLLCAGLAALANRLQAPTSTGPGVTPLGWNPTHYDSACIALSGTNNVIATGTGSGTDCIVYSINGQTTGKYYGEIDITGTVTGETAVGLGNTASSTTLTYLGNSPDTIALFDDASVYNNGASVGSGPGFATGNKICMAIDLTSATQNIWFANLTLGTGWIKSSSATGNPSTGANGFQINATGMTITSSPVVLGGDASPAAVLTIVGNLPCLSDTKYGWGSAYLVGFSPFPGLTAILPAETWNPNRIDVGVPNTFSAGNLTVTGGTGTGPLRATFGTPGFLSGKYYWQGTSTYTSAAINAGGFGVANGAAGAANTQYTGFDNNSIGYYADGSVYLSGAACTTGTCGTASPIAAFATGATICVAADYSNGKVWFQPIGSGQWDNNGTDNPSTNTGGFSISAITQSGTIAISPAVSLYQPSDNIVAVFSGTPCSGVTGLSGFTTIP